MASTFSILEEDRSSPWDQCRAHVRLVASLLHRKPVDCRAFSPPEPLSKQTGAFWREGIWMLHGSFRVRIPDPRRG